MEENNLEKMRHSLAHILMQALIRLYDATPGVGPAISDGFYHDFDSENPATEKDLKKIEKEMKKIISENLPIERKVLPIDEAISLLEEKKYIYTKELAEKLKAEVETEVSFYEQGEFINMCKGPHLKSTGEINSEAFKLTKIAGAYWLNDENNKMLQRIYGLAFETPENLEAHKEMLLEAEKRDHRKIGKELDLFTFSELVGSGLPLFTPKGTAVRDAIIEKIHTLQKKHGYQKVSIPHITKKDLYKTSGHWEKFGDELFKVKGKGDTEFVMKPMNCPHHTQIYASQPRSYRDLPVRYTEATMVYRDEQAGELLGLSRVRSITQDDGHVFCTPEQIENEIKSIIQVIKEFYEALNMYDAGNFWVSLSVRDPKTPEKYLGDKEVWDKSESILEETAKKENLPYKRVEGEAAFYGPKLDFMFKDAIGREWQLATAQLDFNMPKRFELEYTDKDGTKKIPVMIHRAIAGSLERFLSVIIEHFAGAFPFWLAPVQIKVLPIAEAHKEYAQSIFNSLKEKGFRIEIDESNEGLGKKIRKAKTEKIPYLLIIGDKEVESKTITIESRDDGNLGAMSEDEFLKKLSSTKV
ncbi:threonine--tRNA ligase [Patescibacteria group bacterium]